jgi:hypothetical protein
VVPEKYVQMTSTSGRWGGALLVWSGCGIAPAQPPQRRTAGLGNPTTTPQRRPTGLEGARRQPSRRSTRVGASANFSAQLVQGAGNLNQVLRRTALWVTPGLRRQRGASGAAGATGPTSGPTGFADAMLEYATNPCAITSGCGKPSPGT